MRLVAAAYVGLVVMSVGTGCADKRAIMKSKDLAGGSAILTSAEVRAITHLKPAVSVGGRVVPSHITCSEPSPDVAKAVSEAFNMGGALSVRGLPANIEPKVAFAVSRANAQALAQLTERLATIQLLRDGLHRACEAYANGALTDTAYAVMLDPARSEYVFGATGGHGWLHGQPLPSLAPSFLDRQRFKTLSDVAGRVADAGHAKAAEEIASRAFGIAITQVKHSTGSADIVRIDRIRSTVTRPLVLEPKPLVLGAALGAAQGAKTWQLTDPVTLRPTQVRLDADEVLVARIVDDLRTDSVLLSTGFVVKSGKVTVREGNRTDEIRGRIEKIPGVDGIHTSPGLPAPSAGRAFPATKR